MAALYLISTYQCAKLLQESKDNVKQFLQKKLIDYVRDDDNIYRISLSSVMEFVTLFKHPYDAEYLDMLRNRLCPWYEVPALKKPAGKSSKAGRPKKEPSEENLEFKSLGFPKRAMTIFEKKGIKTIEQLTSKTASDLMHYHNFGRKTLKEIREILAKNNLSLKTYKAK